MVSAPAPAAEPEPPRCPSPPAGDAENGAGPDAVVAEDPTHSANGVLSRSLYRLNEDLAGSLHKQRQSEKLQHVGNRKAHHSHGHGMKQPSLLTAVISAIINWMLMFGLCCAYGMIMFSDDWHQQHRGLGVKMNLGSAMIVGLVLAARSKVHVAIGGPDLNPVVFLAGFVDVIGQDIADQLDLKYPEVSHRLLQSCDGIADESSRCLGASGPSVQFCSGQHLEDHLAQCAQYHEQLRATAIFATFVSSAALGIVLFIFGRCKLTRFVSYMPTSILEAFMSCVGYKVFKYALKFCKFKFVQFAPAAFVGVLLYFLKAKHIGNPVLVIPSLLLMPLALFYAGVYGVGSDLEQMRDSGYMFAKIDNVPFWTVWTDSVGAYESINVKAWLKTLPDFAIMLIVVMLDCLLKLKGTETKIPGSIVDKDYETQLLLTNVLGGACGSTVGYMQLKFNVINFGVLGNLEDRRAGIMYALLCGAGFLGTIENFNFQPRFFLGMLLFFAGAGFVAENLWGSRKYLTAVEWCQIAIILLVFILTEKLLYAVVVGGLLCCLSFIVTYSSVPCVDGMPMRGGHFATSERYDPLVFNNLRHIANTWLLVIKLKGFIFFGSAQSIIAYLNSQIEAQRSIPEYRRLRYLIMDCRILDGMDASAAKSIKKLSDDADEVGITVLWAHVSKGLAKELKFREILTDDSQWFKDLDVALVFVLEQVFDYLRRLQRRWVQLHPGLEMYHDHAMQQRDFEPFSAIMTMDTMRYGSPWLYCKRVKLKQDATVLWRPGEREVGLYLVHRGAVAIYENLPESGDEWQTPIAVYRHGSFLNTEHLSNGCSQNYAVALEDGEAVYWSQRTWFKMMRARPHMAAAVSRAVFIQQAHEQELSGMSIQRSAPRQEQDDVKKVLSAKSSLSGRRPSFLEYANVDSACPLRLRVPEFLQHKLNSLHNAFCLDSFGLYDPPQDSCSELQTGAEVEHSLPDLPSAFVEDLDVAFSVYSHAVDNVQVIAQDQVGPALLYAGLSGVTLQDGFETVGNCLSYPEFLRVGQAAVVSKLSASDLAKIKETFSKYDEDGSGELDQEELAEVLRQTFYPQISIEEIDCLCASWDQDASGKIDFGEFCRIISRFMKKHEQEWSMLQSLRDLAGNPQASLLQPMTVESVLAWSSNHVEAIGISPFTDLEVEEMLWAADWRTNGSGQGQQLALQDVVATLLLGLSSPSSALPPEPRRSWRTRKATWNFHGDLQVSNPSLLNSSGSSNPRASEEATPSVSPMMEIKAFGDLSSSGPWASRGTAATEEQPNAVELHLSLPPSAVKSYVQHPKTLPKVSSRPSNHFEIIPEERGAWDDRPREKITGQGSADDREQSLVVDMRDCQARERSLTRFAANLRAAACTTTACTATRRSRSELEKKISSNGLSKETHPMQRPTSEVSRPSVASTVNESVLRFLEEPSSSWSAAIWSTIVLLSIFFSIVLLVVYPVLEDLYQSGGGHVPDWVHQASFFAEIYFTVIFCFELIGRYVSHRAAGLPTGFEFFKKTRNFLDLLAVLPFFVELIAGQSDRELYMLRMNRLARIPRMFRLGRLLPGGQYGDSLIGALLMVFAVIWGIYLKNLNTYDG